NVSIKQTPGGPPNCDAYLTSPLNGATNVPVATNQLNWSNATGGATNYRISMGTSPGGTQIANNIDLGNVNSYTIPVQLQYATTYYVSIVPTNNSGPATGCIEQSFTTIAPITTTRPWEEPFLTGINPPNINGWDDEDGFTLGNPNKFTPQTLGNFVLWTQISSQKSFETISVGTIQNGDLLEFRYAFAAFNSEPLPTAADAQIRIYVSTNYGISYPATPIATIQPDGTNQWKDFSYDLSAFTGQFVRIKIVTQKFNATGVSVGFDDFYIGQEVTCERAENVELVYVGTTSAQTTWDAVAGASNYNWMVFLDGDDPETDSPVLSGNTTSTSVTLNNLTPGTDYDFYVRTD